MAFQLREPSMRGMDWFTCFRKPVWAVCSSGRTPAFSKRPFCGALLPVETMVLTGVHGEPMMNPGEDHVPQLPVKPIRIFVSSGLKDTESARKTL